ncbi:MAG: hypothetical protein Q7K43_06725, partial [Candidatus Woesearchaeota archaeon]|nr:hypothetical protein [Candidatus Woesearchaeota archaeon]
PVLKFILTEALYQQARQEQKLDFLYSDKERFDAFKNSKDFHSKDLVDRVEFRRESIRHREQMDVELGRLSTLDAERIGPAELRRFMNIHNERELLEYQFESEPRSLEEAADRYCFGTLVLKDHAVSLEPLETYARKVLGDKFDGWKKAAYARICVELLCMSALSWNELNLSPHQGRVIGKIKDYIKADKKI